MKEKVGLGMETKLTHIYMGDGKGKTTAAIGLAIRSAGAGLKVIFCQFMKGQETAELTILKSISNIRVFRNAKDHGFYYQMTEVEKEEMRAMHIQTFDVVKDAIKNGECDVLILDEVISAYQYDLLRKEDIITLLDQKEVEIVLTGRNPEMALLDRADYITEMRKIKHPFDQGMDARVGIEF